MAKRTYAHINRITRKEIEAVRYATEELRSYYDTVGEEACLDDEEMPTGLIPDVLARLDGLLARADRMVAK